MKQETKTLKERFPGLRPRAAEVLDYLLGGKDKTISNMVAINVLGQGSLTSRISEIRRWLRDGNKGYGTIVSEWKKDTARNKRYKSYRIVPPVSHPAPKG